MRCTCFNCGTELIWENDFAIEDENEFYCMETNLHCPECEAFYSVYLPKDKPRKVDRYK